MKSNSSRNVLHTRVVTGAGGGPEKTILNSPRFLKVHGYSVSCVYMRHPRDHRFSHLEHLAREKGAELLTVDDRGPLDWRVLVRLQDIYREHQPAIWHGHDYKSNLFGLWFNRSHQMKLVTTVHGWVERTWKTPLYYAVDRFCLRRYDAVVCVSRDLHDACIDLGVSEDCCWLLPNAIDTDEFKRREPLAAAKARHGISPNRFLIGAVGRLSDEKGFTFLIRAVRKLADEGLDLALWIAGEGPEEAKLRRLIAGLGLGERVSLLGHRTDMKDLYHAMELFVLSSKREGLPNVVLEAMAMEVPVVCTRVAGTPDLIKHGENGLLVNPGSAGSLAAAIKQLQTDPQLRADLGRRARATIEESYSFGRRMDSMLSIYETVLGREPESFTKN